MQVWTPIGVVCRPTQQEAEEFTDYIIRHADAGAVGNVAEMAERSRLQRGEAGVMARRTGEGALERRVLARGAYCAIGDPDEVTRHLALLSEVGFDGVVLNFVNFLVEFPYFAQEVLPRLEGKGLRTKLDA